VISVQLQSQVAGELAGLARQGASGALRVGGEPGGTIYLRGGQMAFAESAAAPDLGSRLVNSRRLGVDQWRRAQRDSRAYGCTGDMLLRRGLIDAAEWQALLQSAALDALLALAIQLAGHGADPGVDTAFVPRRAHRDGSALRMDIGRAWAHAAQEAERLAGYRVGPDTRLRLSGRSRSRPVFGPEATAVLGQVDGRATIRELAWRNGLALFGVMDWAARLIQDGVCVIAPPEDAAPDNAAPEHAPPEDAPAEDAAIRWTQPDPDMLRQILARLRQLS